MKCQLHFGIWVHSFFLLDNARLIGRYLGWSSRELGNYLHYLIGFWRCDPLAFSLPSQLYFRIYAGPLNVRRLLNRAGVFNPEFRARFGLQVHAVGILAWSLPGLIMYPGKLNFQIAFIGCRGSRVFTRIGVECQDYILFESVRVGVDVIGRPLVVRTDPLPLAVEDFTEYFRLTDTLEIRDRFIFL